MSIDVVERSDGRTGLWPVYQDPTSTATISYKRRRTKDTSDDYQHHSSGSSKPETLDLPPNLMDGSNQVTTIHTVPLNREIAGRVISIYIDCKTVIELLMRTQKPIVVVVVQ